MRGQRRGSRFRRLSGSDVGSALSSQRGCLPLEVAVQGTEGAPVVILHGLLGSGRNWQTVARSLAENHRVFTLDLRNHGRSPHCAAMGFHDLVADVQECIRRLGLDRVHLLGHSLGGKVAMLLALLDSEPVNSLTVVDIAPVAYPDHHSAIIGTLRRVPLASCSERHEVETWLAASIPDPALRKFLLLNLEADEGRFRWRVNLAAIADALPELSSFPSLAPNAAFSGPALFVVGAHSDYVVAAHQAIIRERFPQARFETIAGAGHWPHVEQPARFLDCLRSFLAAQPRS
jgi:esterase